MMYLMTACMIGMIFVHVITQTRRESHRKIRCFLVGHEMTKVGSAEKEMQCTDCGCVRKVNDR